MNVTMMRLICKKCFGVRGQREAQGSLPQPSRQRQDVFLRGWGERYAAFALLALCAGSLTVAGGFGFGGRNRVTPATDEGSDSWIEAISLQPLVVTRCLGETLADPRALVFEYELQRRSPELASIVLANQSCGCLGASLDGVPIVVGQPVRWEDDRPRRLAVQLSSSTQPRDFTFDLTLKAISKDGEQHPLNVRGRLRTVADLRVDPPVVQVDTQDSAQPSPARLAVEQFVAPGERPMQPPEFVGLPESIQVRLLEAPPATSGDEGWQRLRWIFELAADDSSEERSGRPGALRATVRGTASPDGRTPSSTVIVQVGSRGVSAPREIVIPAAAEGSLASRRLPLISRDGTPFRIERVESGDRVTTSGYDAEAPGTLQWLVLASDVHGPWEQEVLVHTDHPRTPVLKIIVRRTSPAGDDPTVADAAPARDSQAPGEKGNA